MKHLLLTNNRTHEIMSTAPNRRHFMRSVIAADTAAAAWLLSHTCGAQIAPKTTQPEPDSFFTLGQRKEHWWLITPGGKPFFTMGLNHIDPASLRYPENIDIWRKKYGGSTIRWIKESVAPNLKAWGFNTVGWDRK